MRHFISLGMIILLTSCSITKNYYAPAVQSWNGGNAQNLISKWGQPDSFYELPNGNAVLLYKSSTYRPGISSQGPDCITTFEINKQRTILKTKMLGKRCWRGENFATSMSNNN